MNTSMAQREGTRDHLTYFLAGHSAPAGTYREIQTRREIWLREEGILPATCDGHVAVYERLTQTWAEIHRSAKEVSDAASPAAV